MSIPFIEVTTLVQAHFHLNNGEVLMYKFDDNSGEVYLEKIEEQKYRMIIQPNHGAGKEFITDKKDSIDKLFQEMGNSVKFYVVKGAKLTPRKPSWMDKIADFFRGFRIKRLQDSGKEEQL